MLVVPRSDLRQTVILVSLILFTFQVTVLTLELHSSTLPPGKTIALDISNKAQLEDTKKNPVIIKEGVEYKWVVKSYKSCR